MLHLLFDGQPSKLAWFKYHSHPLICIRLAYFAIPSITRIKICRFAQINIRHLYALLSSSLKIMFDRHCLQN